MSPGICDDLADLIARPWTLTRAVEDGLFALAESLHVPLEAVMEVMPTRV